jgi:hypothetical protein
LERGGKRLITYQKKCSECRNFKEFPYDQCLECNDTIDDIANYNGETCDDFKIWNTDFQNQIDYRVTKKNVEESE